MGILRGLVDEEILNDHQLQRLQCGNHVMGVRVGLGNVLTLDEQRFEVTADGGVKHIGDPQTRLRLQHCAPEGFELLTHDGVGDVAVAGELVREGPHIAGALNVVLAAQRIDPYAVAADVPGDHREVRHRDHHGRALAVFGDAQPVVDGRVRPGGVQSGRSADIGGGNTAELLGDLGAVLRQADELLPLPIQLGVAALGHELGVDESLVDDRVRHRIHHGHIGAGLQLQVVLSLDMRRAHQVDAARVDDDQARALTQALLHPGGEHRVGVGGVGPDHDDDVRGGHRLEILGSRRGTEGLLEPVAGR